MGPFSEPLLPNLRISTLGFIPKKAQSEFRMIHQLSFLFGALVNDFIRKSFVQYTLLRLIKRLGRGCTLAKTDVRSAFRIIFQTTTCWECNGKGTIMLSPHGLW